MLLNADFRNMSLQDKTDAPHSAGNMAQEQESPLMVFVDLETTGANFANDRIIEIGLVEVGRDCVREWSSLVNPEREITPFITRLTGIDNSMVSTAPTFATIAEEVMSRLKGRLFVAHNARFDYSFLKREFLRLGLNFRAPSLCTVKLSRRLFPEHHRHSLEALVARYGINTEARHRALADARVLWALWQDWHTRLPEAAIRTAVETIVGSYEIPPQLDPGLIEDLPEAPGAYALYAEDDRPLVCKRSANIRLQVLAHFSPGNSSSVLFRETQRVVWHEAAGEFGARLSELRLTGKEPDPQLCSWQLQQTDVPGDFRPHLVLASDIDFAAAADLYGLYAHPREANIALRRLADGHRLCYQIMGLGNAKTGEPCVSYRQKNCRGACVGKESLAAHGARLLSALAKLRIQEWPFSGPVALVERDEFGMREDFHLFEAWRYLGTVQGEQDIHQLLDFRQSPPFDVDIYRLLSKSLKTGKLRHLPVRRESAR